MEIKRFNLLICFVAFGAAISATVIYYLIGVKTGLSAVYLPMEWLAWVLRQVSMNSSIGNIAAWGIYIGICIFPSLLILKKVYSYKKQPQLDKADSTKVPSYQSVNYPICLTDVILLVLSLYLFFMLYCFINPGILSKLAPEMTGGDASDVLAVMKNVLAGLVYSLIIGYFVLKLAGSFQSTNIWKQTERILIFCTMTYVAFVCFALPLNFFQQYENAMALESGIWVTLMNFFLDLLPMACFVGIMESGVVLIHSLKENKYDQEAVAAAHLMAQRSRRTVSVSVLCSIIQNILQLIFWKQIMHANFFLNIPFLPLILAFAGLLIAEYLKESSLLSDDNQMII